MNIKVNFKKQALSKSNANLILFADEKKIYSADNLKVGLFK